MTAPTPRQLAILQHALGLDQHGRNRHGEPGASRNHYCAGGDDVAVCRELVALGYMRQVATTALFPYYNCLATEAGIEAVRLHSPPPPKVSRAKRRYDEWLSAHDAWGISFGDWLRRGYGKAVRS